MSTPLIIVEKKDGIVTLTLNNPERRNAMSVELVDELFKAVEDICSFDGVPDIAVEKTKIAIRKTMMTNGGLRYE